jgi:DNA modification methylase
MVETVAVSQLVLDPSNARKHNKKNLESIKGSLKRFGQQKPIVVSEDGIVIAGNGTLEAARSLGWTEIKVVRSKLKGSDITAYAIADNRTAELAEWDLDVLPGTLEALGKEFDLGEIGFDKDDLAKFTIQEIKEGLTDGDEIPEEVETRCKPGDLWILGEHRLLCGDSTNVQHVEILMSGDKADLFLSDPPYGVSYTDKNEYLNSLGTGHRLTKRIENDHKSPSEMKEFWDLAISNACMSLTDKSSYYIFGPQGGDLLVLQESILKSGFQLKHVLIWVKNNHILGRCDYHYKHEPIIYGWKQNGTHEFYGKGIKNTTVWDFPKPQKNDLHPTMKPIEVLEEALLNSTLPKNKVLDLFLGSGSTLIACEKTGRKCFGMEIDPHYCDVIISRWEKFTGKTAQLSAENSYGVG